MPAPKSKNRAERSSRLKHDPYEEFRDSAHILKDGPTLLAMPASAIKGAMVTAASDIPGLKNSEVRRLVYVPGDLLPVYGEPKLQLSAVRTPDMKRTPDIRTFCIIPTWAIPVEIRFVDPMLKAPSIFNLIGFAGITVGIGDGRPEKGKLDRGRFHFVAEGSPELTDIVKVGRPTQEVALAKPEPFDDQTSELLTWFDAESRNRGYKTQKG